MSKNVVQSVLIERDLTPDVSETMRIFREMQRDGGTSFAHLQLEQLDVLAHAMVDEDDADLKVRSFSPTDEGPGDDDDDDDDEEDDDDLEGIDRSLIEALREAGDDAPWSPVPTRIAKAYLHGNDDAMLELNFPRVYEENRSSMLADLSTAQSLGYIGHERAAIQAASELGFDDYDYNLEQQAIAAASGTIQGVQPGAGDEIATGVMGQAIPGNTKLEPPKQQPPPSGTGSDDRGTSIEPRNKRDDISQTAQHNFRMQQKTSEMVESLLQGMFTMQRELLTMVKEIRSTPPPSIVLPEVRESTPREPVVVHTPQPIILHETTLETMQALMTQTTETLREMKESLPRPVEPPSPVSYRRRVERDAQGLILAIIDEPIIDESQA